MIDWVKTVIQAIGYPGIALLMIIENIFPPIPSEVIMPFAGFVSEQGNLNFWLVVLSGSIGSVLGTTPFYYLGYKIGRERILQWVDRHGYWLMLTIKDIERAENWFNRHDKLAVLLCRIVPGIRTIISIPAGIKRMNFLIFILLSLLGTSVWVGFLTYLGRVLEQNYDKVGDYVGPAGYIIIGGLILWYVIYVFKQSFFDK